MKFYFLGSSLFSLLFILVFLYSLLNYKKLLKEKKIIPHLFLILRFSSLLFLFLLLLEPHISYKAKSYKEKDINIYIDNSESIQYQGVDENLIFNLISTFSQSFNNKINYFMFGDTLLPYNSRSLNFSNKTTDFMNLEEHINRNLNSEHVIVTDGNSSHGYNISDLVFNMPVNFIGLGRDNYQDIELRKVIHETSIIDGDSLKINIELFALLNKGCPGELFISSRGNTIMNQSLYFNEGENIYNLDVILPTENIVDEIDFEIKIEDLEELELNNTYKTGVNIKKRNRDILLLTGSLNPNTRTIKKILSIIPESEIVHLYKNNLVWNLNLEAIDFNEYELIVYDNFPIDDYDFEIHSDIKNIQHKGLRSVYFEGPSYNVETISHIFMNDNIEVDVSLNQYKTGFIESDKNLKNLPFVNRNFSIADNSFESIYLQYSDKSTSIGIIENTLYILIPEISNIPLKTKSRVFEDSISDMIYLFMDDGEGISLNILKREIFQGERLEMDINFPDIYSKTNSEIILTNLSTSLESTIGINKIKKNYFDIMYIDNLIPGEYTLQCQTFFKNQSFSSNIVDITVNTNNYEQTNLFRNYSDMKGVSLKTNGNYFPIENYKEIIPLLSSYKRAIDKEIKINMHSIHIYWFILVITLIIEWFYRKQKGLL